MENITLAILAMMMVPGAIAGFILGLQRSALSAILSIVTGAVGGLAGASLLSGLFGAAGIAGETLGPIALVAGSVAGALTTVVIADAIDRLAARKAL